MLYGLGGMAVCFTLLTSMFCFKVFVMSVTIFIIATTDNYKDLHIYWHMRHPMTFKTCGFLYSCAGGFL